MNGYEITFYTQQDHHHDGKPVADWIVQRAQAIGIGGATVLMGTAGFGRHGKLHAWRFFEQANQPVEVVLVVSADEADKIFAELVAAGVQVFFVKTPVEFGVIGVDL